MPPLKERLSIGAACCCGLMARITTDADTGRIVLTCKTCHRTATGATLGMAENEWNRGISNATKESTPCQTHAKP